MVLNPEVSETTLTWEGLEILREFLGSGDLSAGVHDRPK
jgi:hypothetical protein